MATLMASLVAGCASTGRAPGRAPPGLVVATGHGWSSAGLDGPTFAPASCHAGRATYQGLVQPLPDPRCTPGAVDLTVTQADLATTICRPGGYTSSVRPPEPLTERAKRTAAAAYSVTGNLAGYEYDHLLSRRRLPGWGITAGGTVSYASAVTCEGNDIGWDRGAGGWF